MSTLQNRQFKLTSRPVGMVKRSDFEFVTTPAGEPGPGEALVRGLYLSLDPAMRGWMNAGRSYIPPVGLGDVMRAGGIGRVEASNDPSMAVGETVVGITGVQDYAIAKAKDLTKVDPRLAPLPRYLGALGMPGLTAYFGLLDIGQPKEGETVVVSAAAGIVGAVTGQIARMKSGAKPVVVLSYAYWRNQFAADPRILGRTIRVNSFPYTVVGIAPDGFWGTELFYRPEIWIPMRMQPQVEGFSVLDNYDRGPTKTMIVGRLKPGITVRQAEADLGGIAAASRQGAVVFHGDWNRIDLTRPGLIGDLFRQPAEAFTSGLMVLSGMVLRSEESRV